MEEESISSIREFYSMKKMNLADPRKLRPNCERDGGRRTEARSCVLGNLQKA